MVDVQNIGIPDKLISLTNMCAEGFKSKVKVENEYSDTFRTHTWVRQEDRLSPILFNIEIEESMQSTKKGYKPDQK